jgi:3-isopropylmalate/(R)-2-methylmalate dehydratase small subunit
MIMQPFTTVTAIAAPFDEANIDTNQLCPTRFNKVPRGPKYAQVLFHDLRFNADGSEQDFILNREPYRSAGIIVADRNFGCGSSRESAVYALYEFGIRCVIAPSFGDIFANNSCKNGLLPVVLPDNAAAAIRKQLAENPGATITVDLAAQTVTDPAGQIHRFDIHPLRKKCLLEGLDDVARTQQYRQQFEAFEMAYRKERSWLFPGKD